MLSSVPAPARPLLPPGTYLRLRREAAGLTLDQAAVLLSPIGGKAHVEGCARALARAEGGDGGGFEMVCRRLDHAFPFDLAIVRALFDHAADPGCQIPVPQVCDGCGCSWHDPCLPGRHAAPCAWRDDDPARCTACPPRSEMPGALDPPPLPGKVEATSPLMLIEVETATPTDLAPAEMEPA